MERALTAYRDDVTGRRFPSREHVFAMDDAAWAEWAAAGKTAAPAPVR
jgi:hypothetical protein